MQVFSQHGHDLHFYDNATTWLAEEEEVNTQVCFFFLSDYLVFQLSLSDLNSSALSNSASYW